MSPIAAAVPLALATTLGAQNLPRAKQVPAVVSGELSVEWEDDFRNRRAIRHTYVFDAATRDRYEVHIDSVLADRLGGINAMRGRSVRLASGRDGRVSSIQSVGMAARSSRLVSSGATTRRVLVLLCRPSDGPSPAPTKANYRNLWFDAPVSVRAYWLETSNSLLQLSGDVSDWGVLPGTEASYHMNGDPNGLIDSEKLTKDCLAIHEPNYEFAQYDDIAWEFGLFIGAERGGVGVSTYDGVTKRWGGTVSGYLQTPEADVAVHSHEYGHALDLSHSGAHSGVAYSSPWDVMSMTEPKLESGVYIPPHTIAAYKDTLGFIPANRRFVATGASSTITLERSAQPASNANYLVAYVPVTFDELGGMRYTLELRQKTGYDHVLPREGVVIHDYAPLSQRNEPFQLVDRDGNGDASDAGAVLVAGQTFEDKRNRVSITVESITGSSARVTIHNGSGYSFAVQSLGKKTTVVAGTAAADDAIAIDVGAPTSAGLGWTARNITNHGAGLAVLTPSGSGPGSIRLRRGSPTLAPGTYLDSLLIQSTATTIARYYVDTLVVTAPASLHLGLSAKVLLDSNLAGVGHSDSALVRISVPGATTAAWTATKKRSPGGLITANGVGNGVVAWNRLSQQGTASGWIVDTITVTLTATPTVSAIIIDSLHVLDPVRYFVSTRGKRDSIPVGGKKLDSVRVEFAGSWATNAAWTLSVGNFGGGNFLVPLKNGHNELSTPIFYGFGNGWGYYYRDTKPMNDRTLAIPPGTYIDTINIRGPLPLTTAFVPSHQGPQLIIDTLVVYTPTGPAVANGLQLSARSRLDTVALGLNLSIDSVLVTPVGPNADTSTVWTVTAPAGITVFRDTRSNFPNGGGKGTDWLRWSRDLTTAAPGTIVKTIQISSTLGNTSIIDSVVVLSGTAVSPLAPSRSGNAVTSSAAITDSVGVITFGTGATTTAWTASKRKAWTSLVTASGTGAGQIKWRRDPAGLSPGLYVDTITINAAGARGGAVIDSFVVMPKNGQSAIFASSAFDVDSVGGVVNMEFSTTLTVNLTPTGQSLSSYSAIVDWDSTVVRLDSARSAGFAQPTVNQANGARLTLSGTDAPKSGSIALAKLYYHFISSNIGRQTTITPTFTSARGSSGTELASLIVPASSKAIVIPGALRGDVNLDGKITSADALMLVRFLVGILPPNGSVFTFNPNGDANCSGKTEAIDLQYVLARLVGLPTGTACVGTVK